MMTLSQYFKAGPGRRAQLAMDTGSSPDYLWQIATGWRGKRASPDLAVAIDSATSGAVTCEELRPDLPWVRVEGRPMLDAVALAQRKLRPDAWGSRSAA